MVSAKHKFTQFIDPIEFKNPLHSFIKLVNLFYFQEASLGWSARSCGCF